MHQAYTTDKRSIFVLNFEYFDFINTIYSFKLILIAPWKKIISLHLGSYYFGVKTLLKFELNHKQNFKIQLNLFCFLSKYLFIINSLNTILFGCCIYF